MSSKLKRIFSAVLVTCMLVSIVPLNAMSIDDSTTTANDNTEDIKDFEISENNESKTSESLESDDSSFFNAENSDESEQSDTEKEIESKTLDENNSEEIELTNTEDDEENDNWELSLVFYDSSVNNGKTPLTEINWDASDGGYDTGETRIITAQINYKNTNVVTTYIPGELEISIPNLAYKCDNKPNFLASIRVGANDKNNSGYDWDFVSDDTPTTNQEFFIFKNAYEVEEKTNFEGSIQIVYSITPNKESPEYNKDECIHNLNMELQAELNEIKSNICTFTYERIYVHPWKKAEYTVKKTASKLTSLDGIPNAINYIWVKFTFSHTGLDGYDFSYPYICCANVKCLDIFPSECVVYDSNLNLLQANDNGEYRFSCGNSTYSQFTSLIVGYPKSIYNEENNNIIVTNHVDLVGKYGYETEETKLSEDEITINLSDFEFIYSGNLYKINKSSRGSLTWQDITGNEDLGNNVMQWYLQPNAIYTGTPMTVKIGDDLLYITDGDGYSKLDESEYAFTRIEFWSLKNGNNLGIAGSKYDCELWVRHKGDTKYELYSSFKNPAPGYYTYWDIGENSDIASYYFIIKDMTESLSCKTGGNSTCVANGYTTFKKQDLSYSGKIYNFAYIQVYFKDSNENLILQNEPTIDSYKTLITKEEIAQFDKDTYGKYLQRDYTYVNWGYIGNNNMTASYSIDKKAGAISQNAMEEKFEGTFTLSPKISQFKNTHSSVYDKFEADYLKYYDKKYQIMGYEVYDLLPKDMILKSTVEDIKNSEKLTNLSSYSYYDTQGNKITPEKNVDIEIKENWNGTGRTWIKIKIIFSEPVFFKSNQTYSDAIAPYSYTYKYEIPYDSVLENGVSQRNYCYICKPQEQEYGSSRGVKDDGSGKDSDAIDINENGNTDEYLSYSYADAIILSAISTNQDVTKYVKTDNDYFTKGIATTSHDSEYEYKLRVRTGQNNVTNLIIYDSIEEYVQDKDGNIVTAYGSKSHWNGEFLGVDTSYAESKGYFVKTYYSENPLAGNLYNDDGSLNSDYKRYANEDMDIYKYGKTEIITSPNWPNNYDNNMTEDNNYWEVSKPGAESLEITFDSTCRLESANYDYLRFYDRNGNNITSSVCGISADKIGGTSMAGKTYTIPGDYVKITMRTDSSGQYKGFSANIDAVGNKLVETIYASDKSKVKALAFEYLDVEGNPAVLPANSLTYVLIKMKSLSDENITSLAYNGCRTQWQAIDEHDRPVDFITGINSNIVKVSLPNSVEDKIVNLSFKKIIDATGEDFDKLKLDKDATYNFFISLTNQETGDVINGLLNSKEGFHVNNIPIGTYIIKEEDDIWFSFVCMVLSKSIEGIDFKEVDGNYILAINETVEANATIEIEITNKPDEERFYDSKYDIKNLFKK